MASFSSSEVSNMISSKKYHIKKGDTLSVLAEKFQSNFASLKSMNKNSLMDKIYNVNKSAFGGNKDIIFEGRDLDLKFVLECRNNLKLDKSKPEYVFTDEDNLVFAIKGANGFWDDFVKIDRDLGEYFKKSFREMGRSSLPKSMPLPMNGRSSSSSNNSLMNELKKNLRDKLVTTQQIAEEFFKLMKTSYNSSQVKELAFKIERENGVRRANQNVPCAIAKDNLEKISCKSLEECYAKMPLSSSEKDDLKKGVYKVSKLDRILFAVNKNLFWGRIYQHSDDKKINEEARKGLGLSMDKLEGDKIFVATEIALNQIDVQKTQNAIGSLNNDTIEKIKYLGVYANYLKSSIDVKQIWVTSAERDAELQANLVYESVYNAVNQLAINSMYKGSAGLYVEVKLKQEVSKETILSNLSQGILNGTKSDTNLKPRYIGFNHISNSNKTVDIGANLGLDPRKSSFRESLRKFISVGVILDSRSIEEGDKGEKDCHHLVFK